MRCPRAESLLAVAPPTPSSRGRRALGVGKAAGARRGFSATGWAIPPRPAPSGRSCRSCGQVPRASGGNNNGRDLFGNVITFGIFLSIKCGRGWGGRDMDVTPGPLPLLHVRYCVRVAAARRRRGSPQSDHFLTGKGNRVSGAGPPASPFSFHTLSTPILTSSGLVDCWFGGHASVRREVNFLRINTSYEA